jgi:cytochrome P450
VRKVGIMDRAKPVDLSSPVTFDTTSPEYVADPYPILRGIQETEPLRKTAMGWLVTRYEDAANLLRESRIWGSGMTPERRLAVFGAGPMFEYASRRMNGYNPPEHTRLRSLITKASRPAASRRCARGYRSWRTTCCIRRTARKNLMFWRF